MVEAEREIESRVAPPGAFGIEEHRTARANQDVLRADVAVHQREPGGRGDCRRELLQSRCKVRMHVCGRQQVRLEPDGMKDRVGGKARAQIRDRRRSRYECARAGGQPPRQSRWRRYPRAGAPSNSDSRASGRYSIAKTPARASSASTCGTASGKNCPTTSNQAASFAFRSTGAYQSTATLSFGNARFTQKPNIAGFRQPDIRRDAAGQASQHALRTIRQQSGAHDEVDDDAIGVLRCFKRRRLHVDGSELPHPPE